MKTADFAKAAGLTERQLQYWDEHGVLVPQRLADEPGRPRIYDPADVPFAIRMATIARSGWPLREAAKLARKATWSAVVVVKKPTIIGDTLVLPRAFQRPRRRASQLLPTAELRSGLNP